MRDTVQHCSDCLYLMSIGDKVLKVDKSLTQTNIPLKRKAVDNTIFYKGLVER